MFPRNYKCRLFSLSGEEPKDSSRHYQQRVDLWPGSGMVTTLLGLVILVFIFWLIMWCMGLGACA